MADNILQSAVAKVKQTASQILNPVKKDIGLTFQVLPQAIRNVQQTTTELPKFTFAEDWTKGIQNPALKTVTQFPLGVAQSILNTPQTTAQGLSNLAGEAIMIPYGQANAGRALTGLGQLAEARLNLLGLGGAPKVVGKVATLGTKELMKKGAIEGAKIGGAYGLATGIQMPDATNLTIRQQLGEAAKQGVVGATIGAGTGLAVPAVVGGVKKVLTPKGTQKVVSAVEEGINIPKPQMPTVEPVGKVPTPTQVLRSQTGRQTGLFEQPSVVEGKTRQRGFVTTMEKSPVTKGQTLEVIEQNRKRFLTTQKSMQQSVTEAENIAKNLSDEALLDRLKTGVDTPDVKTALAIQRIKRLETTVPKRVKELMKQGLTEIQAKTEAGKPIADFTDEISAAGTEWGRGINMFRLWNQMSPVGLMNAVNRSIEKINAGIYLAKNKISDEVKQQIGAEIISRHGQIQKIKNAAEREIQTAKLFEDIAKKLPTTAREKYNAYVYQNMLSGPQTQLRNIFQNALQTLVTRPADMTFQALIEPFRPSGPGKQRAVTFGDVGRYYSNVFSPEKIKNSIIEGVNEFKGIRPLQGQVTGEALLNKYRQRNLPMKLKVITNFMSSMDAFFSTAISQAEEQRFTRLGFAPETAKQAGKNLAEEYLFRADVSKKLATDSWTAGLIGDVAENLIKLRKGKYIGPLVEQVVPFISTPANAGKAMAKRSLLGFMDAKLVNGTITNEQISRAMGGSLLTALGGMFALAGRVQLDAPTDPTARKLFYDSGRRPNSVYINGVWVPFSYLGPYALAFATPAIVIDKFSTNPASIGKPNTTKAVNSATAIAKFLADQTPLAQATSLYRLISGEPGTDFNPENFLAFTLGKNIPGSGFLRSVTEFTDPTYRKAKSFEQAIQRDLPFNIPGVGREKLEPYMTTFGEEAKRAPINRLNILPYDVGFSQPEFEKMLQNRLNEQRTSAATKAFVDTGNVVEVPTVPTLEPSAPAVKPPVPATIPAETQIAPPVATTTPTPTLQTTGLPVAPGGDQLTSILNQKQTEQDKYKTIMDILQAPWPEESKQKVLATRGFTPQDVENAKYYKMKNLSVQDKVKVIQSLATPDYKALYDREILTLPVAKEMQKAGIIKNAQSFIDGLKERDISTPLVEPTTTGLTELDKINMAAYNKQINAKITDVTALYNSGQLDAKTANDIIKNLQVLKDASKTKLSSLTAKKGKKITLKKISLKKSKMPKLKAIKLQTIKPIKFAKLKKTTTSKGKKLKTIKVRA